MCYFSTSLFTVQEKLVTKQVDMASDTVDPLVTIQRTKSPDIVENTAELLADLGRGVKGDLLKGQ